MKKSAFIELVLVTGLLGSNSVNLDNFSSETKISYSKPGYIRAGFYNAQDTVEKKATHSGGSFFHPGGFGFWGHAHNSGS